MAEVNSFQDNYSEAASGHNHVSLSKTGTVKIQHSIRKLLPDGCQNVQMCRIFGSISKNFQKDTSCRSREISVKAGSFHNYKTLTIML